MPNPIPDKPPRGDAPAAVADSARGPTAPAVSAEAAIRGLLALGYRVIPPDDVLRAAPQVSSLDTAGLATGESTEVPTVVQQALRTGSGSSPADVESCRALGDALIRSGNPVWAYDVIADALVRFPTDLRLRQLQGHALTRAGALPQALAVLEPLYALGNTDEETLGFLASARKALALGTHESGTRQRELRAAHELYARAYSASGGYWSCVNAATTALLAGDVALAQGFARHLRERYAAAARASSDYWLLATMGEAALILGDLAAAEPWYRKALGTCGCDWGSLASTRRNARLLLACHGQDPALLRTWLPLPRVAVFTGHMVDQPGRAGPRFPPEAAPEVERALATLLADLNVGFGYAAAANGGDLIFLDLVKRRDGETHIVLPYGKERFRRDSVGPGPGCDWAARFDRALEQACEVVVASSQRRRGGAVAYAYTADLLLGMAAVHADQIEAELVTIALWDGKPGDGLGGTASTVERWRALGHAVHIIPLPLGAAEVRPPTGSGAPLSTRVTAADGAEDACGFTEEIKALLFADVVRYSHLTDEQIPVFVTHFLGAVGRLLEQAPVQPVMRNTWGDALYFVFDRIADAGSFALDLRDRLCRVDWAQIGLPPDLNLRIALHAGPVYACTDPITGQAQFTGTHVSRAARIEPVTPPGRIFASKPFAALAAAQRVTAFRCEYVGLIPLAKGYGVFPTYHVRRGHSG